MCLFKTPKPQAPKMPALPPVPSPPPAPTPVDSQTTQQDLKARNRLRMRAGLASTIKTRSNLLSTAEAGTVGTGSKTLG